MFIKVLPSQVPMIWEQIKYAVSNADRVDSRDLQNYLSNLLGTLLSDKAQCFVRLGPQRTLLAVVITRFMNDEMTGDKTLLIQSLYSFSPVPDDEWLVNMNTIESYAIKKGCKKVMCYSNNDRVFELASQLKFQEHFRCFVKEV